MHLAVAAELARIATMFVQAVGSVQSCRHVRTMSAISGPAVCAG